MLNTPQSPYNDLTNKMINISGHPEVGAIWGIFATIINTFFSFYFLLILHLSLDRDPHCRSACDYLGLIIKWTYMKRHIINLDTSFFKAIAWQCFLASSNWRSNFYRVFRNFPPIRVAPYQRPLPRNA